jgi:hypothetical protein
MASIPQVPEIQDQDLAYYLEQLNLYLASQQPGANVILNTDDTSNFSGGYLNRYLAIAYANSASGLDFSNTQANRAFFATYNSNSSVWSSNPADYVYFETNQGFGSTRNLNYQVLGGRQIAFAVDTTAPNGYATSTVEQVIDLDLITAVSDVTTIAVTASPGVFTYPLTSNAVFNISNVTISLDATDGLTNVSFAVANTDSANTFVNNSIRIGANANVGGNSVTSTLSNLVIQQSTVGFKGEIVIFGDRANQAQDQDQDTVSFPIRYRNGQGAVFQLPTREIIIRYANNSVLVTPSVGSSNAVLQFGEVNFTYTTPPDSLGFTNGVSGSPLDVSAGTVFCNGVDVNGNVIADTYVETGNLFVLANANISGDISYTQTGTPANTSSVVGYVRIVLNGANAYIPYYQ